MNTSVQNIENSFPFSDEEKPNYFQLGATLYTPCSHPELNAVMKNNHLSSSSVFCLEDAIKEDQVFPCISKLETTLLNLDVSSKMRFIRPRNLNVFRRLLQLKGIEKITGFVLPKIDEYNFESYMNELPNHSRFAIMPTIETDVALSTIRLSNLLELFNKYKKDIFCIRIGGNDLLNLYGLKRLPNRTIYETPVRMAIDSIVSTFRPSGYQISSPVFDIYDDVFTLERELEADIAYGLYAKTAIHPSQVPIIESAYRVTSDDYVMAKQIVDDLSPAVFKHAGQMVEPTTQYNWALNTLTRCQYYGIKKGNT